MRDVRGMQPSGWTYSSVIAALTKGGMWQEALQVFDEFLQSQHSSSSSSSSSSDSSTTTGSSSDSDSSSSSDSSATTTAGSAAAGDSSSSNTESSSEHSDDSSDVQSDSTPDHRTNMKAYGYAISAAAQGKRLVPLH
jgi:pentatricopeptide repeat protein